MDALTADICLKVYVSTKTTSLSCADLKLSAANDANDCGAGGTVSMATRFKSTLLSASLMSLIWLARVWNIIALTLVCTGLEDVRGSSGPGSGCRFGSVGLNRVQELRITASPASARIHRLSGRSDRHHTRTGAHTRASLVRVPSARTPSSGGFDVFGLAWFSLFAFTVSVSIKEEA